MKTNFSTSKLIHTTEFTGTGTPIRVAMSGVTSAWLIFTGNVEEYLLAYDNPAPHVTIGTSVSLTEPSPWEPINVIIIQWVNLTIMNI